MEEKYTQHGAFSWCELVTKDVNAAKTFYTKLFGWTTEDLAIQGTAYTIIKAGGKEIGGIIAEPGPMAWGAYVTVDDVDATAKSAEKTWGEAVDTPHGHSRGRTVLHHPGSPGGRYRRHHVRREVTREEAMQMQGTVFPEPGPAFFTFVPALKCTREPLPIMARFRPESPAS